MTNQDMAGRLATKTPQQQFLHELRHGFRYPPPVAQALLETAQRYLERSSGNISLGKVRVILARQGAPLGRPLGDTELIDVIWTVDNGAEDADVLARYGSEALRRVRILRLLDEAVAQDAAATFEDLARVLHVSRRTLQRDATLLRLKGYALPTRGHLPGKEAGQSYKVLIVSQILAGKTHAEIEQYTHHSPVTVRRCIADFCSVVWLHQQMLSQEEIVQILSMRVDLVESYLELYRESCMSSARRTRLEEVMAQVRNQYHPGTTEIKT
jgi:hypothetical protein